MFLFFAFIFLNKPEILRLDSHEQLGLEDGFAGVEGDVEPGDTGVG